MFDKKKRFGKGIDLLTAVVDVIKRVISFVHQLAAGGSERSRRTYIRPEHSVLAAWQQCIREEIGNGTYRFHDLVRVETKADTGAFVRQGTGRLTQNEKGTVLECRYYGEEYTLIRSARSLERIQGGSSKEIGDYVDLPVPGGCFRCYLSRKNMLARLVFATEEIHRHAKRQEKDGRNNRKESGKKHDSRKDETVSEK